MKTRWFSLKFLYLISSLGIALTACSVVGLLLYSSSMEELRRVSQEQLTGKLCMLAEDFDTQRRAMAEVSYTLPTEAYYKRYLAQRTSYFEIEFIKGFSQYRSASQINEDYFLLHHGTQKVYKSTEAINTFDVFQEVYRIEGDQEALYQALSQVRAFTVVPYTTALGAQGAVFAYPVLNANTQQSDATLGFFVPAAKLENRFKTLVGDLPGEVYLYYQDEAFAALAGNTDEAPQIGAYELQENCAASAVDGRMHYVSQSPSGLFKVALVVPEGYLAQNMAGFRAMNTVYMMVAVVLVLALAVAIGYGNYRPIRKLQTKYVSGPPEGRNEIDSIERFFDGMLLEKQSIETDLQAQYALLRQQILKLLLSGDGRYRSVAARSFMGIYLPGPWYCVYAIRLGVPIRDAQAEELASLVEELSENDMYLYFTPTNLEGVHAVIASLPDDAMAPDASDYVRALFEEGYALRMGASALFGDLADLPDAFGMAALNLSAAPQQDSQKGEEAFWYDEALALRIVAAVQAMDGVQAHALFLSFSEAVQTHSRSFAFGRFAYFRLVQMLAERFPESMADLRESIADKVVLALNEQEVRQQIEALLSDLCARSEQLQAQQDPQHVTDSRALEMIEYLGRHYSDPAMSLDLLSEEFGLSNRYISGMIKEETGLSYKDYLTKLRIERAQELLLAGGVTATQACERVGYTHLPHFIKTFKRITSCTPASYSHQGEKSI